MKKLLVLTLAALVAPVGLAFADRCKPKRKHGKKCKPCKPKRHKKDKCCPKKDRCDW